MQRDDVIQLSDHFSLTRLIRFTISPICTMVFISLYSIVDGFFVSNYVGATAFASLNLTMPYIMMTAAVGFMFGSGGNAYVSMLLGQENREKARRSFSLIVYVLIGIGLLIAFFSSSNAEKICRLLGASDAMLPYCMLYLKINMLGLIFFMLQNLFQTFLITAERPRMGLMITLLAGCSNMFLDWLLVGVLKLGLAGAAYATIFSQAIGGGIPLLYFIFVKRGVLYLTKPGFDFRVITRTCGNGVSEFLSNVSSSIVGFLYNLQLLRYAGENGVSAYGVIMYVSFVFVAIFLGYSMGMAPIVGFHYGAANREELRNIFPKSMLLLTITSLIMTVGAEVFSNMLVNIFVGYDADLRALTLNGMRIYNISFLAMGYNIFASAFFTALNNGTVSALISVSRALVLEIIMIYLLPWLFGLNGLWCVVIAVEGIGAMISAFFILKNHKKYGYL